MANASPNMPEGTGKGSTAKQLAKALGFPEGRGQMGQRLTTV